MATRPYTSRGPRVTPYTFDSQLWGNFHPGRARARGILGRYPACRWGGSQAFGTVEGYPPVDGLTLEDRLVCFRTLSSHLPSWPYILLPPHDLLTGVPMMVNEGDLLLFIEPAPADVAVD